MSSEHGLRVEADPNITRFNTGHYEQRVEMHDTFIVVDDPQLGSFVIGDNNGGEFYRDLFTTYDAFRSFGISQLSKQPSYATVPNTAGFNRYWHTAGLFRIVEHFSHSLGVDQETTRAYTLAAVGDDRGHGPFSHGTDMLREDWAGLENSHETVWEQMGALGGTKDVLDKHNVRYDQKFQIPGIELPGFLVAKHPDINVDNFQYAVTELLLWFDHDQAPTEVRELVRSLCSPNNLELTDDNVLAFKDLETAQAFSKGYLLLTTEHWNDPINRVQLHLLIEATKRAITHRRIDWMDDVDKGVQRHPYGYLYGIDQDIASAMETGPNDRDDFMYAVRNMLHSIAMQERERYTNYKMSQYAAFLTDTSAYDYPSELLEPTRVDFGPPSSQVSITVNHGQEAIDGSKMPRFDMSEDGICYTLFPLKNRRVDPLVAHNGTHVRLSKLDPNYKNLLREQQQIRTASVTVRLALAGSFEAAFKEGIRTNESEFSRLLDPSTPRMTRDQERKIVTISAERAKAAAISSGHLIINT